MGNFSKGCLVHYTDQHIQVRKDFLDLCAYDKGQYNTGKRSSGKTKRDEPNQECMAKILRLLETLTDKRRDNWHLKNEARITKKLKPLPEPKEYRIELAYSTIVRLLYNTYGESTVRNSIAALIQMGYITRHQATKNSVPEYELNIPFLQIRLQEQAECQDETEVLNSTPDLTDNSSNENEMLFSTPQPVNSTPEGVNVTPQPVNSTPNNIENKRTHNISFEKGENERSTQSNEQTQEISILSSDQQIFFHEIYCHSKIGKVNPDKIDQTLQKHLIKLMEYTKTVEELDSLYEYVQKRLLETNLKDKTVYPGNLTNAKHLGGWLQEKEREVQNMDPYVLATMQSAGRLKASTPGSQYIVDTLSEAAEAQLADMSDDEIAREAIKAYYSQPTINGMTNFAASGVQRSTSREKKHREILITTGPLAGQPDFHADPWA